MKSLRYILLLCLFPGNVFSQDIEYARSVVKALASPEFKGRGYVEDGDRISSDYIASEFAKMGLMPLFGNSWFQNFSIDVNTFPGRMSVRLNETVLAPGVDYIVDPGSPSVRGKFRVIRRNRSQIDTEQKVIELINEAGNNFILIDSRGKKEEEPGLSKKIDEYINFLQFSKEINTGGIIILTNDKLSWHVARGQAPRPVITVNKENDFSSINTIDIEVDARLLRNHETRNVAGAIKGTSGSDSMIVVTAHYDHLGKMGKDTYFPGANDNASGVAMILNLAKHYSVNKPRYTTLFIALSAEELGIVGAGAFTEKPPIDLSRIKFLVNFDLAGTGEEGIRVVNGSVFKDKFDLLTKINTVEDLLPKVDIRGAACNSDHCMFYQKGVPCFYIYTQGGISAYHDVYDKSETLPLTEFSDYCRLMIGFFSKI